MQTGTGHWTGCAGPLTTGELFGSPGSNVDGRGAALALAKQARGPVATRGTLLGVLVADVLEGVVTVRGALALGGTGEPVASAASVSTRGARAASAAGASSRTSTAKHGKQRLGVGASVTSRSRRGIGGAVLRLGRQSQDLLAHQLNGPVEVLQAQGLGLVVALGDEAFDLTFVLEEEGVDVLLVEHASTLGLGEHEVAQEEQTEPAVEGEPVG